MSDKSTLVSIVPWKINEEKSGVFPGRYQLNACNDPSKPECLIIGECVHYVYFDENRGNMPVYTPSHRLAHSIVNDYLSSMIETSDEAKPGFFALPDEQTSESIKIRFQDILRSALALQLNWFKKLVALADDDWNRYHKHIVISDIQRIAANKLDYKRDWTELSQIDNAVKLSKCPACLNMVHPDAIVCSFCKCVLKAEEYKKMQFASV